MLREKLFTDIMKRFPCLTAVRITDTGLYVNRTDDPFLQDENYQAFSGSGLPRELADWRMVDLKTSGPQKLLTAVYTAENPVFYLVSQPEDAAYHIVMGPFSLIETDSRMVHEYSRRHHFHVPAAARIPRFSLYECMDWLCIAHEMIGAADVSYESNVQYIFFEDRDQETEAIIQRAILEEKETRVHSTYAFEQEFEQAIITGDQAKLEALTGRISPSEVGRMSGNGLKQLEYTAVALVTLVARIAIRAGVNEVLAYRLSDYFLQQISGSLTVQSYYNICRQIMETYMEEIRHIRSVHVDSIHIEHAKNYIRNHRNQHLTVADVAEHSGISTSYLSALFRQYEELTVKQFILHSKLEGAANMLRYSDYDIAAVSEYFCFASPSHFAAKFREYYGCTPGEYRKKK